MDWTFEKPNAQCRKKAALLREREGKWRDGVDKSGKERQWGITLGDPGGIQL